MSATHRPPAATIFIGNIPYDVTEQMLMEIFQEVGPVKSLRLVNDRDTGKPKGYGFCEYYDVPTAESAMRNLNGHEVNGRSLRVDYADEHQAAREGGGGGGGGGGGRGPKDPQFRPPTGPAAGNKPIGQQAVSAAAQQMVIMLGGTPGAGGASQEKINQAISAKSPAELYEVMAQMKTLVQQNPAAARQLLTTNPQLVKALFQAQIVLGMVKAPPPPAPAPAPASSQPQYPPAAGPGPSSQPTPAAGGIPPPPQYPGQSMPMPMAYPQQDDPHMMPPNLPQGYAPPMQQGYPMGGAGPYGGSQQMPPGGPGMLPPPPGGQGYGDGAGGGQMPYPGPPGQGGMQAMPQMQQGGMPGGYLPPHQGPVGAMQQGVPPGAMPQQPPPNLAHLQGPPAIPPQQPLPQVQPVQQPIPQQGPPAAMYLPQAAAAPQAAAPAAPAAAVPAAALGPEQQKMLSQVMQMSQEQVNSLTDPAMKSQIMALRERARAMGITG